MSDQLLLVRQSQPSGRSATGNDERLGVDLLVADMQQKRTLAEIRAREVRHAIFRTEALRLLAHVLDELRPHDSFGESWKVLHERGHGELASGFMALDDKRFEVGTRGVERGSVAGASRPDDDDLSGFAHG